MQFSIWLLQMWQSIEIGYSQCPIKIVTNFINDYVIMMEKSHTAKYLNRN